MTRTRKALLAASLLPAALVLSGFIHSKPPRRLESITVSPASATGANRIYTATGKFNTAPERVTPLSVSWYLMGPAIDPPGPGYKLEKGSFRPERCMAAAQGPAALKYTVIALAPANPDAPRSGSMPFKVFEDLVIQHTRAEEDGFLAGTASLYCE
jgi:hypothetical protein